MFSNKELIIFDMDGTLIDSAPSLAYALNQTLESHKLPTYELATIRKWIGNGAEILIKRALVGDYNYEQVKIDNKFFHRVKSLFLEIYGANLTQHATLYDGVEETLQKLAQNYLLALATNKPAEFVSEILNHFQIEHYFHLSLGAGSVAKKKPDPQILLAICEKLESTPEKSVMVGDSKNDLLAAKAANMDSIALTYGYNQGADLSQFEPTVICNHFSEIEHYFKGTTDS